MISYNHCCCCSYFEWLKAGRGGGDKRKLSKSLSSLLSKNYLLGHNVCTQAMAQRLKIQFQNQLIQGLFNEVRLFTEVIICDEVIVCNAK